MLADTTKEDARLNLAIGLGVVLHVGIEAVSGSTAPVTTPVRGEDTTMTGPYGS